MSNSSLISFTRISPNCNKPRNHKIDTITIHCVVGQLSVETMGNMFMRIDPSSSRCSANYGIGSDGRIGMYVEECNRSWCSSSSSNDNRAITIECACDPTHPYAVNGNVMTSLIKLCADICKRNGIAELKWKGDKSLIGQVDKQNMTVHRWFKNKACPGEYLYNNHGYIASEVNAILNPTPTPTPIPPTPQPVKPEVLHNGNVLNWQKSMNIGFDFKNRSGDVLKSGGLEEDGYFGNKSQTFANEHQLYKGIKNCMTAVKWLQNRLTELGFYRGLIDGKFEDGTHNAVVALEKARGLTPSGWVGVKVTTELLK